MAFQGCLLNKVQATTYTPEQAWMKRYERLLVLLVAAVELESYVITF